MNFKSRNKTTFVIVAISRNGISRRKLFRFGVRTVKAVCVPRLSPTQPEVVRNDLDNFQGSVKVNTALGGSMQNIADVSVCVLGRVTSLAAQPSQYFRRRNGAGRNPGFRRNIWAFRTLAVACLMSSAGVGAASATGFFLKQQSVTDLGRVNAGSAAAADNLGTVFFNPAGLIPLLKNAGGRLEASLDFNTVVPLSEIRNSGSLVASPGTGGGNVPIDGRDTKNPTAPVPLPSLYLAKSFADGRAAIGASVNGLFGLTDYSKSTWFGRYDAIKGRLVDLNFSVVGAYEIAHGLSVGGGIDAQYAEAKLVGAIPNPLVPGGPSAATDARAETIGHGWVPGYNVGVLYAPEDDTRIGVHYRSAVTPKIDGSTTFSGLPGPLSALNGVVGSRADLKLPAIGTIGIWHDMHPLKVMAEFEWDGWSSFDELRIRFDDSRTDAVRTTRYRDAYGVAVGAEYPFMDWVVRGGVRYETTPTRDQYRDTLVPDSDRVWLGLGASYKLSDDWTIDFAATHVFFQKTNIALKSTFFEGTPLATQVQTNGTVKYAVETVSFGFRHAF
jgi:long-chain fatty acid transport protein